MTAQGSVEGEKRGAAGACCGGMAASAAKRELAVRPSARLARIGRPALLRAVRIAFGALAWGTGPCGSIPLRRRPRSIRGRPRSASGAARPLPPGNTSTALFLAESSRQTGVGAPANHADLRFNLSHSKGLVLYAVASGREVGVDVEQIRFVADFERITEQYFSLAERTELGTLPAPNASWTVSSGFGL